jgi:hypothetical protein
MVLSLEYFTKYLTISSGGMNLYWGFSWSLLRDMPRKKGSGCRSKKKAEEVQEKPAEEAAAGQSSG